MITTGPMSDGQLKATRLELVRLTLGGRPERPELVMSAKDWAAIFTERKRRNNAKKRRRR